MTRCPYCQSGRIAVEPGSSLTYPCPDCRPQDQAETMLLRYDPRDCDDRDHIEPTNSETKGTQ